MSQIQRMTISNPSEGISTKIFTSNSTWVASVIISNKESNYPSYVDVWVSPADSQNESNWGYILKNAKIDPGNALETFRFSLINNDCLYIRCNSGLSSFTLTGINQA